MISSVVQPPSTSTVKHKHTQKDTETALLLLNSQIENEGIMCEELVLFYDVCDPEKLEECVSAPWVHQEPLEPLHRPAEPPAVHTHSISTSRSRTDPLTLRLILTRL